MAIMTNSGRAAVADILKSVPIHLAWGRGNPAWDTSPEPVSISAVALVDEVGRRKATQVLFCNPDPDGEIIVPNGQFKISATPTKFLYTRFHYDYGDAVGEDIRELGVMLRTKTFDAVPANKSYLVPDDIEEQGDLFLLNRVTKIPRKGDVRQQFEFVIQL